MLVVANLEDRITQVELTVNQLKPSLDQRLTALEAAASKPAGASATRRGRLLAWLGAELPKFIFAAVLLGMTYLAKDSFDKVIRGQQLQLSFTKEMQAQLEKMSDANATDKDIERAALLVAAYGGPAVVPLLNEMRYSDLRANAAEEGLRYVGLLDPDSVCEVLPRVLTNRTGQFGWNTHLRVIRLLGQSGCEKARSQLVAYKILVKEARGQTAAPYFDLIADRPKQDEFDQLDRALDRAQRALLP